MTSFKNRATIDKVCTTCGDRGIDKYITTCGTCKRVEHLYCMKKPTTVVPVKWRCENCVLPPKYQENCDLPPKYQENCGLPPKYQPGKKRGAILIDFKEALNPAPPIKRTCVSYKRNSTQLHCSSPNQRLGDLPKDRQPAPIYGRTLETSAPSASKAPQVYDQEIKRGTRAPGGLHVKEPSKEIVASRSSNYRLNDVTATRSKYPAAGGQLFPRDEEKRKEIARSLEGNGHKQQAAEVCCGNETGCNNNASGDFFLSTQRTRLTTLACEMAEDLGKSAGSGHLIKEPPKEITAPRSSKFNVTAIRSNYPAARRPLPSAEERRNEPPKEIEVPRSSNSDVIATAGRPFPGAEERRKAIATLNVVWSTQRIRSSSFENEIAEDLFPAGSLLDTMKSSETKIGENDYSDINCSKQQLLIYDKRYGHRPLPTANWKGDFMLLDRKGSHSIEGIQGHLPAVVAQKVFETLNHFSGKNLKLKFHRRTYIWSKLFREDPPTYDDIGVYFFPPREQRLKEKFARFKNLIDKEGLALQTYLGDVELLIFTSTLLPQNTDGVTRKEFLWGIFRHVRRNKRTSRGQQKNMLQSPADNVRCTSQGRGVITQSGEIEKANATLDVPPGFAKPINRRPPGLEVPPGFAPINNQAPRKKLATEPSVGSSCRPDGQDSCPPPGFSIRR